MKGNDAVAFIILSIFSFQPNPYRISRRILFEEKRERSPNLGVNLQDSLEITDHLNDDRVPEVAEETDSNGHQ